MAKRVTNPIKSNELWDDDEITTLAQSPKGQPNNGALVVVLSVIIVLLLAFASIFAYHSIQERANTTQQQYDTQIQSSPAEEPIEEKREPVNISLSGSGASSTQQFELASGTYLVSFTFSNNASTYGATNFISKIKCADSSITHIANDIAASGSGSEYLSLYGNTKCTYNAESASPQAQWTATITDS